MEKTDLSAKIDALLPQTQCQECGFKGCLPYAEALAKGEAAVNLCLPGGETVTREIAHLLARPLLPVAPYTPKTFYIDESLCIGCMACIKVCPVDAIVGTTKKMHTVINGECTGCGLCVPSCPLDCIYPQPEVVRYLPKNTFLGSSASPARRAAEHAKKRFDNRNKRLERIKAEKEDRLTASLHATKQDTGIAALLARAKSRAASRKNERVVIEDTELSAERLRNAQQKSAWRKAQKDFLYGTPEEREKARDFLQKVKNPDEKGE